jgi:hypothetical protein
MTQADTIRGIDYLRLLPDGRELTIIIRAFNTILTIGPAGEHWFDDQW